MQEDSEFVVFRYKYGEMDDGHLKIITDGTLKFSKPSDFNDPFDCSPAYDIESVRNVCERRPDLVKKAASAHGMSPAKRIMSKGRFAANAIKVVESGDWSKGLAERYGVLCLSRNPCQALMWAHYARHHTGFLVEFRLSMEAPRAELDRILPAPVKYVEQRPILDWADKQVDIEGTFFTKSSDWAYEEEERALDTDCGPGVYPYSRELFLNSVVAGAAMTDKKFKVLQDAVAKAESEIGKKIPLYRAKLSSTSYKVFIPGHPNPLFSSPD